MIDNGGSMTIKAPEPAVPAALTCPEGHAADPHDRFCPACGSAMEAPAGAADTPYGELPDGNSVTDYFCEYTATIYDIPSNHDQYTVTVGTGRRGDFTYSREEMDQYGWDFEFTLGG